jgi:RNA polymerase sigma factor (sigma-70 family)
MSRCEYDDLFQEGTLGLMRAAARFDPSRNRTFAAFALRHIHGAVSRALAERFATVRVPVKRVKEAGRLRRERNIEQAKGNRRYEHGSESMLTATTANLGDEDVNQRDHRGPESSLQRKLGDVLRHRYEVAIRAAGERLSRRGRGRADRRQLIERVINDRLLIPEEAERASLREIAGELNCTAGRALACQRQIAALAASLLRQDPVYQRVRELAAKEADSLALVVDDRLDRELASCEERHFASRLQRLGEADLRFLLPRLADRACGNCGKLALLLFRSLGHEWRARTVMELAQAEDSATAA